MSERCDEIREEPFAEGFPLPCGGKSLANDSANVRPLAPIVFVDATDTVPRRSTSDRCDDPACDAECVDTASARFGYIPRGPMQRLKAKWAEEAQ